MRWDVHRFAEIDSTNTWLTAQARAGAPEGMVAVADVQTAGRGRLGRTWEAPPGANVLCSVLLRPDRVSHLVVACVSLAALDACRGAAGVEAGLKWPNDVMVGDEKLAGVLAEVTDEAVVVGIGINVAWAPPGAARLGPDVRRDDVLERLLEGIARWYDAGWDEIAKGYRDACTTLDRAVRVEMVDETFTGVAADVTAEGHLLVDVGVCIREVTAADVVHLRPA
ncbi:MAG: Biotin--protein ligase(EC (EC (EC [uncultured Acidimicrobiales bacterium]|uniref:biotin--[biotin carboxyl-carrier protein] ligase n=1 Tax=uncultured Acidimicrobiales bacterium TaxID=310071 RepID=A0A6J4I3U8_9ACTN|nr:MAG: Biotin--protein ligase(EC (EC (EC [uncultured Acidimicrobiales bacterium]